MSTFRTIISKFNRQSILVIGDLILDQYLQGSVSRISPEAPVPVVLQKESFYTPGGAANVANNLAGLQSKVTMVGVVGKDQEGALLLQSLKKKNVNIQGIFADTNRPTITKTRVMAQNQQVVRIDKEEMDKPIRSAITKKIFDFLTRNISKFDAIILSDYGKGLLTPELVHHIVSLSVRHKKIITVDPKVEHFGYYRHVTAITPNLKETENAIRSIKITSPQLSAQLGVDSDRLNSDEQINLAGKELLKCLDLDSLLVTLSERGMRLFERGKKPVTIKTKAKAVYDVTGAGDAVISVFTLSMAAGATKHQAADLSNFGAGIVVGKLGAVAITKKELSDAVKG